MRSKNLYKDLSLVITPAQHTPEVNVSLDLKPYIRSLLANRNKLVKPVQDKPSEKLIKQKDTLYNVYRAILERETSVFIWNTIENVFKTNPFLDPKIKEALSNELKPLVIQTMEKELVELIKNSVDALIYWNLNPRYVGETISTTVNMTLGLRLNAAGQLSCQYSDNSGGLPETYMNRYNAFANNPKSFIAYLQGPKIVGDKANAAIYFGGAGKGTDCIMSQIFAHTDPDVVKKSQYSKRDTDEIMNNLDTSNSVVFSSSGNSARFTFVTSIEPFEKKNKYTSQDSSQEELPILMTLPKRLAQKEAVAKATLPSKLGLILDVSPPDSPSEERMVKMFDPLLEEKSEESNNERVTIHTSPTQTPLSQDERSEIKQRIIDSPTTTPTESPKLSLAKNRYGMYSPVSQRKPTEEVEAFVQPLAILA